MSLATAGCVLLTAGSAWAEDFSLILGEQRFDPIVDGVPPVPAELAGARSAGADLRLVQFDGPIMSGSVDMLEDAGLQVIQYIHPYTYIVWGDGQQLQLVTRASNVRWTGDFLPAYRLLPRYRLGSEDVIDVKVLVVRAADAETVADTIEGLGGKVEAVEPMDRVLSTVRVFIPANQLAPIAQIPGVYSVQPQPLDGGDRGEMTNQICANNVSGTNQAFPGYGTWLASIGLSGAGVRIANVDSGLQDSHPALASRVIPCVGGADCGTASSQSSHGTHTAGIMAADPNGSTLDAYGFKRAMGVAPGANLIEQLYSPTYTQTNGMLKLMYTSRYNNCSLSGNSWGPSGTPLGYDNNTRQVDVGTRDADPNTPGNQPLLFVLSIMNGNGGTSTQGTPDEAKNIFTIGSTKGQTSGGVQILQIDDLSSNSAHGPCLDGRKIPHLVAPGCYVDSSVTTSSFGLNCGTSMASPHVSGAVALFVEYYRNLPDYSVDPSPALIKAAFCAAGKSLAGKLDASGGVLGHPFDSKQGWGRMILPWVVDPNVPVRYFDNPMIFDNTGEEWVQAVSAFDPSKPVRIMLAWTDAPGHGLGGSTPAWNNNLDLEVSDGTNTFRGNVFNTSTGWSQTGGTADDRNNTEAVYIGPTATGAYTIKVKATNINSDGVPATGDLTDQDFALVCYNCALEPTFTLAISPPAGSLCAPGDSQHNIAVASIQGYTDDVTLSASGLPAGVSAYFSTNPVTPPGNSTLTLDVNGAAAGEYPILITGTSGAIVRSATVNLSVYTAPPVPPALTFPANGQLSAPLRPIFTWNPAPFATSYAIQVARDAAFSNIVASASGLTSPSFQPAADLLQGKQYFWRVQGSNPCGIGAWSSAYYFTTRVTPAILLVDDDDNAPNVQSLYTQALISLGVDYDLWDTNNTDNEPSAEYLSPYCVVIWFTGDEFGGTCGPGAAGEAALQSWLETGKNLLFTSQDYFFDRRVSGQPNAFMINVLGVASIGNDVSPRQTSMTGTNVYAGLGPYTLNFTTPAGTLSNWTDNVTPGPNAQVAFTGNNGNAGITKDSGVYKLLFLVVPLETAPAAGIAEVIARSLDWFYPCAPALCPGDMNCDGSVNFDDIDLFVEALSYPGGDGWPYAPCPWLNGDTDNDGDVDFDDIDPFVGLIGTDCP